MPKIIGRLDPYTVEVLQGVQLSSAYVAGGLNVSAGELAFVDFAFAIPLSPLSGFGVTKLGFIPVVSSGSGNIITIQAFGQSGVGAVFSEMGATGQSAQPIAVVAVGH